MSSEPSVSSDAAPPEPPPRVYATGEIAVEWRPGRCIHSEHCRRALPAVFDPARRPWIDPGGASPEEVIAAVQRCPSGALHVHGADGAQIEDPGSVIEITVTQDGPLHIRGPVTIATTDGVAVRRDWRMALCRCGHSAHKPFCDGTHRAIGFRDPSAGRTEG